MTCWERCVTDSPRRINEHQVRQLADLDRALALRPAHRRRSVDCSRGQRFRHGHVTQDARQVHDNRLKHVTSSDSTTVLIRVISGPSLIDFVKCCPSLIDSSCYHACLVCRPPPP